MPSSANRKTRLTPSQGDYFTAMRWYKRQSSEPVAERSMLEVEQAPALMRLSPGIFPTAYSDRRRALLKVFPSKSSFIFAEGSNVLIVIGIVHNSRNPSLWQERLLPGEDTSHD